MGASQFGKEKVKLQGDRVETPTYIKENNLTPDYSFYITNQIMKPVQQLFALVLETIPDFKKKGFRVNALKRSINSVEKIIDTIELTKFDPSEYKKFIEYVEWYEKDKKINKLSNIFPSLFIDKHK